MRTVALCGYFLLIFSSKKDRKTINLENMRIAVLLLMLVSFVLSCQDKNKQKDDEVYRDYHPNGQLFRTGTFDVFGKKGKWLYYDEDGKLLQDENYKNDKADGTWNWYDQNGEIKKTEIWKNGEKLFPKE